MNRNKRNRWSVPGLAIIAAAAMAAMPVMANEITDDKILDAVETKFLWDSGVFANDIDVRVNSGIVTLGGESSTLGAKRRATMIAKSRKGVRSVVNQINVEKSDDTDAQIAANVRMSLGANAVTTGHDFDVQVNDGTVTLKGDTNMWGFKQLAEQVATDVAGVREVKNEMTVNWDEDPTDKDIQSYVQRRLRNDVWVDSGLIDVAVKEGVVTLSGTVGSVNEKDRAAARSYVTGVDLVKHEDLTVREWAKSETRKTKERPQLSDNEIKEAIKDAFLYDPRVISFNPSIKVNNGYVTLSGSVDNLLAKQAAVRNAKNTVGVQAVTDHLKIRTDAKVDDKTLKANLETAFKTDAIVEARHITAKVKNGRVTLHGDVNTYYDKVRAESIASGMKGIKEVTNNLNIDSTYYGYTYYPYYSDYPYAYNYWDYPTPNYTKTDREIKEDVESEFWWSWFIDGDDVTVTVDDGVVTLSGTVDDAGEKDAAEKNAWDAGAVAVDNNLKIDYTS